jgi:glycosyltransferase involved in cell wall biosynthesis
MQDVPHLWRIQLALLWQQMHVRLFRRALKQVDGIVGVSEGILQVYRASGLELGKLSTVVYNLPPYDTVDEAQVASVKQTYHIQNVPTVLYAGKFSYGKGTQILVQATDQVIQKFPNTQFLFAGHGNIQLADSHMRNLGSLHHDHLQALYHLADIVVIPSIVVESLSRVGLEAMAAGKPLIGTNVGGTPEQIEDGVTGLLVPRKEPAILAEAIIKLLSDETLRKNMGIAAQKKITATFSYEANLQKMEDFYGRLLTG